MISLDRLVGTDGNNEASQIFHLGERVDRLGLLGDGILPFLPGLGVGLQGGSEELLLLFLLLAEDHVLEAALGPFEGMLGGGDDAGLPPGLLPLFLALLGLLGRFLDDVTNMSLRSEGLNADGGGHVHLLPAAGLGPGGLVGVEVDFCLVHRIPLEGQRRAGRDAGMVPGRDGIRANLDLVEGDGQSAIVLLGGLDIILVVGGSSSGNLHLVATFHGSVIGAQAGHAPEAGHIAADVAGLADALLHRPDGEDGLALGHPGQDAGGVDTRSGGETAAEHVDGRGTGIPLGGGGPASASAMAGCR
mmetsp:Transcript_7939/g.22124  ORF Transcript_7939/g.22124 Transcript_7939/m.22124 type:complete len:303 (+) Transcript_7939:130-1038(+)